MKTRKLAAIWAYRKQIRLFMAFTAVPLPPYMLAKALKPATAVCRKPPMMHRDLKSPNVLLSEEGVAKIADVGMVRAQVKDLVTAQPVMTPLWAAPEVGFLSSISLTSANPLHLLQE